MKYTTLKLIALDSEFNTAFIDMKPQFNEPKLNRSILHYKHTITGLSNELNSYISKYN